MYRRPKLDLDYAHEMMAPARQPPRRAVLRKPRPLELTARLRCLKALYDLDRDRPSGEGDGLKYAR